MHTTTTRRALLGGAGLATAALIAPAVAATHSAPVGISPAFAALIAANAAAEKACKVYDANVCAPLTAKARTQAEALPHTAVIIRDRAFSTAVPADVMLSRAIIAGARDKRGYRDHRTFAAAAIRRKRAEKRIWAQSGAAAASEESDRLTDVWADAQGTVAAHPVSTAADLHAKLAFMLAYGMAAEDGWFPYLVADAARVVKMEGR
ncbi:hypothetical protein BRX43_03100 [Sphingomonas sp. S-NIH.Pt15_0812]|nr:hypothetical protein BRX43_03100 [Sphingomonas sp. S-NIH.Pt15_0812]